MLWAKVEVKCSGCGVLFVEGEVAVLFFHVIGTR